MATAPEPMIGTTVHIIASTPATEDATGYGALSMIEIGKVLSIPEFSDDSEAGSVALLKTGRTQHYNGTKIVPPFVIPYVLDLTNAGQDIVRSNANGSTEVTLKIAYVSGLTKYIQGVLGNLHETEATPGGYHGQTIEFRSITGPTTVES